MEFCLRRAMRLFVPSLLLAASSAFAQFTINFPPPSLYLDGSAVSGSLTFQGGQFFLSDWDFTVDRPDGSANDYHYTPDNSVVSYDLHGANRAITFQSPEFEHHHFAQFLFVGDPFLSGCPSPCHPHEVLLTDNDLRTTTVPEPSTYAMLSVGLLATLSFAKRRVPRSKARARPMQPPCTSDT